MEVKRDTLAGMPGKSYDWADEVITVIEAAGYRIVSADRWDRVRRVAGWADTTPAIGSDVARPIVMPGDLEGDR